MAVVLANVSGQALPDQGHAQPPPGSKAPPLSLAYIANCGALISSGDAKVLVDALFDRPNPEYHAPAPAVLEAMMKGRAPFNGIRLVLVTHDHPDHFDAGLAVRYLEAVPGPLLLAPADAVEAMRRAAADWARIGARVLPLDLKVGEKRTLDLGGISVTALRTLHSGNRESPMNLMYLLELGGWRVFHEGDSPGDTDEYRRFGLGGAPVDLALVHFWFPFEPNCARFLQEDLRPGHLALTHLPIKREGEAPGMVEQVRKYYEDIFLLLPGRSARKFEKAG